MQDVFDFADELGPAKIVHIHEPGIGLRAIVAIDNVACGPSIGGIRMATDVSAAEAFRLARAMTLKNAAAGLPHGGGESVIFGEPKMELAAKERLIRGFARAIADLADYIPGPDIGTDERCMAWIHDEIGRSVGLPPEIGGIPLDEIGATGFEVGVCADVAKDFCGVELTGARVAVQGFGSVGQHAARFGGKQLDISEIETAREIDEGVLPFGGVRTVRLRPEPARRRDRRSQWPTSGVEAVIVSGNPG